MGSTGREYSQCDRLLDIAVPGVLVPRTNQADYVSFRYMLSVCGSPVGRVGGHQYLDLDPSCSQAAIIHEIGHALGLLHEHARLDRNNYVTINLSNVIPGKEGNFVQGTAANSVDLGAYDFRPIMHYSPYAFAVDNTVMTVAPKVVFPDGFVPGSLKVLSTGDEAGMRKRYCGATLYNMPTEIAVDIEGGSGQFFVGMAPYCTWTLTKTTSWLTVSSPLSGMGTTQVNYTVSANTTGRPRSAAIRINGRTVTLRQPAVGWE